jgi:hypothetical protein
MRIEWDGPRARLALDRDELRLLRFALERASFIDTPTAEQLMIASSCSRALDLLTRPEADGARETARAREAEAQA